MKHTVLSLLCSILFVTSSCMKDDESITPNQIEIPKKSRGVFITNEGQFRWDNASLSYYDIDSMKVINNVFSNNNELILGDIAQSMVIRDSLGYVVINNSSKIYVININTFKCVGKISGLTSPRYMHFLSDTKAYVTDLYAKAITIVNPKTFEVTGQINVNNYTKEFYQHPTEQMVQYKNFIFTNCWSFDNKILVIDSNTDQLVDSITVLKQPTSITMDKNNKIWTVTDGCYKGSPYGYEAPGLISIDAKTRKVEETFRLGKNDYATEVHMNATKDTVFFLNYHLYYHPINSNEEPKVYIEYVTDNPYAVGYYGLEIDPQNGDIYLSDPIDYCQAGNVMRFNSNREAIDTFKVGLIPGAFCFK